MGQKTHPHGLRVGIHRKWSSTWYAIGKEGKNLFFHQYQIEEFFKMLLHFYAYTKISLIKKVLLADAKFFKYGPRQIYIFIFFYKFRNKRRQKIKRRSNRGNFAKQSKLKR